MLFKLLTQAEIAQVVDLMFNDPRERLAERRMVTPEARAFSAREGFNPVYGARPLRRYIALR